MFSLLKNSNNRMKNNLKVNGTFKEYLSKFKRKIKFPMDNSKDPIEIIEPKSEGIKGEPIQSKIFNWLSKLSLDERRQICTIFNKLLIDTIPKMYGTYKRHNDVTFEPNDKMLEFFEENDNSFNSFFKKYLPLNEEVNSSVHKELKEFNSSINNTKNSINDVYDYNKYFVYSLKNESEQECSDADKLRKKMEIDFLNNIKFISSVEDAIIISDELLNDIDHFIKLCKFFSNNNCFKDWLDTFSNENGICNYYLPTWMVKNKSNLTFCQIISGFIEQSIIINYEYFFYTNKIYQSLHYNKIIRLIEEINSIEKQLNEKTYDINNIFSNSIIDKLIEEHKFYTDLGSIVFNELKEHILNINEEKQKIMELIKRTAYLGFNEKLRSRAHFYSIYNEYIIKYFEDDNINDLLNGDKNKKISKKRNKKNRKNKNNVKSNEKSEKEEKGEKKEKGEKGEKEKKEEKEEKGEKSEKEEKEEKEEKGEKSEKEEKTGKEEIENNTNEKSIKEKIEKENEQNENKINEKVIEENECNQNEGKNEIKVEKKDNKEEKKNKKKKEFHLFLNNINKNNKENKKKMKEMKKIKFNLLNKTDEKQINSNDKLVRIISKNSVSTYKSSNYQEEQYSIYDENENDDSFSYHNDIQYNLNNKNSTLLSDCSEINNNKNDNNNSITFTSNNNNSTPIFQSNNYGINHINHNNIYNNNENTTLTSNNNKITPKWLPKYFNNYNFNNNSYNNIKTPMFPSINYSYNIVQVPLLFFNNNYNNFYNQNNNFNEKYFYDFLEQGIKDYCKITNNNVAILRSLKDKYLNIFLENIINENLKDKFEMTFGFYGSFYTGLSIEGSDIDTCIIYKQKVENKELNFGEELLKIFKENEHKFEFTYVTNDILNANRPLISVQIDISKEIKKTPLKNQYNYLEINDQNKIKIDFTFDKNKQYLIDNNKNVEYIKKQIKEYPEILPLVLVLKRYMKRMLMDNVYYGGISSFSIFLIVLNTIKSYKKDYQNKPISLSFILILIFKKFSFFKFREYGIGTDNYDFVLKIPNVEERLYILNPLTGINIFQYARCRGVDIKETFFEGFNYILEEYKQFNINMYNQSINNKSPITLIIKLFSETILKRLLEKKSNRIML